MAAHPLTPKTVFEISKTFLELVLRITAVPVILLNIVLV
jgi:hypothetical protein